MQASRISRQKISRYASAAGMGMILLLLGSLASAGTGGSDAMGGAYLGVSVGDMTPEKASSLNLNVAKGAYVLSIDQDGPACRAGLKARDVIVSVNGKGVQDSQQLSSLMRTLQGGNIATVTVIRDGKQQDIKVTLGNRQEWMAQRAPISPPVANNKMFAAGPVLAPVPPVAYPTVDVDVPVYTPSSARRGLVVESLTPQLGEFFGAPQGQGVLVRNVQKGSTAANAGLKAGDVIIRINGEAIRDLADWRRSMSSLSGKATFSVIRDKREQAIEMNLPSPTSRLESDGLDWDELARKMDDVGDTLSRLTPELRRNTELAGLNSDEFEKMQREINKSVQKQMKEQSKEIQKSMKQLEPEMKKQAKELQKQSKEIQQQMEHMRPEIEKQMAEARKQMDSIGPEFQKRMDELRHNMVLKQEDIDQMRQEIQDSMKNITPEIQQQMQELQKQMEQWKMNWPTDGQVPNQL